LRESAVVGLSIVLVATIRILHVKVAGGESGGVSFPSTLLALLLYVLLYFGVYFVAFMS